tara:strand:+ start:1166 stop:1369 length:204 start_codon:yes stop_codon:yes gene_type:complete
MAQNKIEHKEAFRLFWMVKGHLNCTYETAINCYNGYFKRCWYNEEAYIYEDKFEEAYVKKFGPTGLN